MSNAMQNVYTNSSFRSDIVDSDYEEVVVDYHSTVYDDALSVQKAAPSKVVRAPLPNIPQRKVVTHSHQKIQISLPLLFLIIICSLIAIILTGVVTFLITKDTLPEKQDADKQDCFWSSWSFWSKCSITCGNGTQVRIRQQINTTELCSYNEAHENKICSRGACPDEHYCYWSSWSFWSKCSITCGNGTQVRIRQQMNNTRFCRYNETHENKNCSRGTCPGDEDLLDMIFSRRWLYKNVFISADNTIISNVQTIDTSSSAEAQLQNYRGTISDLCVGNNELIYYEVYYTYTIVKALTTTDLVLEVGLADRLKVDRYYYVGSNNVSGWSFHVARNADDNSIYVYTEDSVHRKLLGPFSTNTVGKKVHGKFKLSINRRRNEFSLRQNDSIFHVFKNVTSGGKLCPVFGVYNPNKVHVKLQLMNPRNFTNFPWRFLIVSIFILNDH